MYRHFLRLAKSLSYKVLRHRLYLDSASSLTLGKPRANVNAMLTAPRNFLFILVLPFVTKPALAQLRPLDQTDFRALNGEMFRAQVGTGVYFSQYASLAGSRGRLIELGDVRASIRSGRVVMEVAGTLQRFFTEETLLGEPAEGVIASGPEGKRRDAGDYRVQTILRLTNDTATTAAILRFGTRLPTTDNRVGLERDQTDFFATVGAARSLGPLHVMAEAGLGINGTRLSEYEQSDVMIYAVTLERRLPLVIAFLSAVGQDDLHSGSVRGNEDLGELRAGLRIGQTRWVQATFVRGYHASSPRSGFVVGAGVSFGN